MIALSAIFVALSAVFYPRFEKIFDYLGFFSVTVKPPNNRYPK